MKRILSTCFGIVAVVALSAQCSVIEVPLAQRASASTLIVEGRVTAQYSYWNTSHNMIYTANTIELYKIFKGNVSTTSIEIITEGGIVGLDKIEVEPTLMLEPGQVGMFTCTPVTRATNNPVSRVGLPQFEAYASLQGFVKYDEVNQTGSDLFHTYTNVRTEVYDVCAPAGHHQYIEVNHFDLFSNTNRQGNQVQAGLTITNISPTSLRAGTGDVLTITGTGFGAVVGSVGFKNADDGGATYVTTLPTQILSWSTTSITVEVPQNAGTGTIQVTNATPQTGTSSQTLTVTYAHLNVEFDPGTGTVAYQTDHVNDNAAGGYTWRMNTAFDADASARASFMRAFDTWRCGTNVNWTIGTTTSTNAAVSDGTNIICFDNTSPLSAGILGVCYSYWSGCASGPTIVWYVNELDIIFDEGSNITPLTWEYGPATPSGSEYDFETVAVHELGHGHQLGHVISPGAIMHYAISNGTSNRALGANDLAGGQFVQAKSIITNVCGPGAMSNYTGCGTPPVAAFSGTPTTVCAGGTVVFTDASTNTPTSWQWTLNGGTPSMSTLQNPSIVFNTPGTYDITLVATNGSGSDSETMTGYITVVSNPTLTPVSQTNIACNGGSTGAASVSISGGTPTYTYNWTPGNPTGDGTTSVTGLAAGTWTCTVTDANSCTDNQTFNITQPTALSVTAASQTNISCNGGTNGAASVNAATGGAGGYSYNWTPGNPTGDGTTSVTGLAAGTWTCTVTDANSCTDTQTFNITQPSALSVTAASQTNILCNGGTDGAASVNAATGGTGGYSYNWTPGNPTGDGTTSVTGLAQGTWTCTVTDANSCTDAQTFSITEPTAITGSISSTPSSCVGNTGTATVSSVSGGTPGYTYNWSPSGGTAASATNLAVGNYTCTVTDANGCTLSLTVAVGTAGGPTASSGGQTNVTCNGGSNGSATVTASGGTAPYTYSWAPAGGTAATATGLAAGNYTCTVTDDNSCEATQTFTITQPAPLTIGVNASPATTVCAGTSVTLSGTGAVSYSWTGGVTDGVPFVPASTQSYTVTGTDGNGCTGTDVATVTVNSGPSLNITSNPSNGIVCSGNQATLTASGAQSYSWTGGITNGVAFTPASTTTYTVTGTGSNGCTNTAQSTITVNSCSGPTTTVPCGITITNKSQKASAVNVIGATQYRFKFYDNSTLALVGQVTQASRTLTFTSVPGIYYGNTYRWTVAVNTGSGFGSESSIACTVTLAVPQTTLPCGYSYSKFNGYSAVTSVYGSTGYRYSFYDNITSALVAQVAQASNYIYFNQVPNLQVGTTYKWTVEVQYNNGSGLVYGPASNINCLVTMNAPTTTVPCNNTYNKQGGYTVAQAVSGATGYRFTFYQSSVQVAQVAQTSNYIYFNQVTGIWNGNTYQWTVEVQYNNGTGLVYGPASAACNITFSSSARIGNPDDNSVTSHEPFGFAMLMYPNPLGDNVNPTINITGADQQEATVTIVDLTGRVITTYQLFVEGDNYATELAGFPELVAGMYIMQVQIGEQVQTQRFIAE